MVENYITLSLETHLFFSRIMKEHALFLTAGFPCKNKDWIEKTDSFRQQFESLLWEVVKISNGRVNRPILDSDELVTEFTILAEKRTERLSGIPINTELSEQQQNLRAGSWSQPDVSCPKTNIPSRCIRTNNREMFQKVHRINERAIHLLNGLIDFKKRILNEVKSGKLFTANYPLLIEHIMREAKLYRSTIENLMRNRQVSYQMLWGTEEFWNQIMMEHALFIRGLLDPCEEELIQTADDFAMDYKRLLKMARQQDCAASRELTQQSLKKTLQYQEFKTAGTKGILNLEIASIILPLLADHVLREANHYIRILKCSHKKEGA